MLSSERLILRRHDHVWTHVNIRAGAAASSAAVDRSPIHSTRLGLWHTNPASTIRAG